MQSITKDLGGTAFPFDGGDLLATSTLERVHELKGDETLRIKAINSPNSLIRTASKVIGEMNESRGRTVKTVDGESYLFDWRRYPLPDGPTITITTCCRRAGSTRHREAFFVNVLLLSTTILLVSLVLTVFVSKWWRGRW